ncbi:MAG: hypothetical protein ACRC9X_03290 [Bacteroidales bacterium]
MKNTIITLTLLFAFTLTVMAEEVDSLDFSVDTLSRIVEVTRSYEPTLPAAYKINSSPQINDTTKAPIQLNYSLLYNKPLSATYMLTPLSPAKLQSEPAKDDNNSGLVRLGLGYKTSTLFDAYYGSENAQQFVWSVFANHRGNYGNVKNTNSELVPNLDMRNEIGAMGTYQLNNAELKASIGFLRKDLRFFGYDVDSFQLSNYKETDPKQYFNTFYARFVYDNPALLDTSTTLRIGAAYYFHNNRFSQAENGINIEAVSTKQLRQTTTAQLSLFTDFYQYNADDYSSLAYEVSLVPQLTESRENWEAALAFDLTLLSKHTSKTSFNFLPSLSFAYFIAEGAFVPYTKFSLFNDFVSFANITNINPYINPFQNTDIQNPNSTKIELGAKGKLGSMFKYNLEFAYAYVKRMVFFINSPIGLGNYFDVHNNNVNTLAFQSDINLILSRSLELKYGLEYTHYEMKGGELERAYNRPSLMMNVEANYNFWNKLNVYASGDLFGRYYALNLRGEELYKKAGFYMNLGLNYRFFNRSSAFIQFNNIFARRYEIYNNYSTYGFNGMIGYSFVF